MTLLSVITINYNNKKGLERTILSVITQTAKSIEFIVIDGGSTDGSKELIDAYASKINYFVSEKDNGIYDAQNKGILKANGDYLLFLNSGDTFYDTEVVASFLEVQKTNKAEILYGNTNLISLKEKDRMLRPPAKLDLYFLFRSTINHQASFIKRALFNEFGMYDTKYKICSDFDFFLKVFLRKPEAFFYFDRVVCNYDNDGASSDNDNYEMHVKEKQLVLRANLPEEQYKNMYKAYRKEIPLKYRIFEKIYKVPVLNGVFKKFVSFYEIYNQRKPSGS